MRREVGDVLSWNFFVIRLLRLPVLTLLKELESLGEVEDSEVVLLELEMNDS